MHTFSELFSDIHFLQSQIAEQERPVHQLYYDSRLVLNGHSGVFFALKGNGRDGHHFIPELMEKGVNQWIITDPDWARVLQSNPDQNWILVDDALLVLQRAAAKHRAQFQGKVIGITGSNGKTIVKEWLTQLIGPDALVCKSPKSFNSQIGVPISVWNLTPAHQMGIFEAGISKKGEMQKLQEIIAPTMGIFTNIGTAHAEGFAAIEEKTAEKLQLFSQSKQLILEQGQWERWQKHIAEICPKTDVLAWYWTRTENSFSLHFQNFIYPFQLPFSDPSSIQNLGNALASALLLGISPEQLQERLSHVSLPEMRLSVKEGQNQITLIDDSYTNDPEGLEAALQFTRLQRKPDQKLILILSGFEFQQNETAESGLKKLVQEFGVNSIFWIGNQPRVLDIEQKTFSTVEAIIRQIKPLHLAGALVLIKGSRRFGLERLVRHWEKKIHGTRLEINLDALVHNLNFYKSQLPAGTKLMAMVKALGYGSGGGEIARTLAYQKVDYLAVAYVDEGIALRQEGIQTPIMVMNPMPETLEELFIWRLEPEIYSFQLWQTFLELCQHKNPEEIPPIHIKVETGMMRLGFFPEEIEELGQQLAAFKKIRIASVFSHLAAADSDQHLDFSKHQIQRFETAAQLLREKTGQTFLKHLLNSAGILRFPEATFDMVRLGIGLYGVEVNSWFQDHLEPVSSLRTSISQVKDVKPGDSIGYNRKGKMEAGGKIAVIAIGYADGFRREFSNGHARVWIKGMACPTIGNVCMDMTMVDVSHVACEEGDEVVIFEKIQDLVSLANAAHTIPYEILTGVGQRVKRIFYRQ